ncbi:MAG: hypothetical protein L6408_09540 [Nanoarchaeota archaeon]|nr:hypothetical protein [Nanoarchaeota archaeon]
MNKIQAKIVIEILGTPKGHVEETMKQIIEKLKNEKGLELLRETTYESKQLEEPQELKNMWSTFSDMEIEVEEFNKLVGICFDYMPSSIEILDPFDLKMETADISEMLNDLMAKLHKVDMALKNTIAHNTMLQKKLQEK